MSRGLIDSHTHLDFPQLASDRAGVLKRAQEAGLEAMLSIGTTPDGWKEIVDLAEATPSVFATVGLHPCDVKGVDAAGLADQMTPFLSSPKVVGLGETGLDFFHKPFDAAHQKACLDVHMQLGLKHDLPLVIHSREAEDATVDVLKPFMEKGGRCVMHCFSGTMDFAQACLDMGCYISFSGIITFKKADALRDVVRAVPWDRILVETDAPYLAPEPFRGKTNQPAFVVHTAQKVGDIKDVSLDTVAEHTTANFYRLFSKAKAPACA